ncbi:MAG: outer membrane protein assembly factor BamB [Gammaproteobacteria bacterium]|jgi:outer membrane protein assembly factor BamB
MKYLVLFAAVLLTGGCSLFSGDNAAPPSPLTQFETTLKVRHVWQRDTSTGTQGLYYQLKPYLSDGVIYVASLDGDIKAYDAKNGDQVWAVKTGDRITGGLKGGDGLLIYGTGRGQAVAIRAKNGEELWRTQMSSIVMSMSDVHLGTVVVRSMDGKIAGLSSGSGEILWVGGRKTPALSLFGMSSPHVQGNTVIAGFDNGKLLAFTLDTGRVLWETTIATPQGRNEISRIVDIDGNIDIRDGVAYVATYQGRVGAVNISDGKLLWSRAMSSYQGLTVGEHNIYLSDADSDVWALDRNTGASLWKQTKLKYREITAPALSGDYIVVADYNGYVHWLSKYDGHLVARDQVGESSILDTPLAVGDMVYFYNEWGWLTAVQRVGSVPPSRPLPGFLSS